MWVGRERTRLNYVRIDSCCKSSSLFMHTHNNIKSLRFTMTYYCRRRDHVSFRAKSELEYISNYIFRLQDYKRINLKVLNSRLTRYMLVHMYWRQAMREWGGLGSLSAATNQSTCVLSLTMCLRHCTIPDLVMFHSLHQ